MECEDVDNPNSGNAYTNMFNSNYNTSGSLFSNTNAINSSSEQQFSIFGSNQPNNNLFSPNNSQFFPNNPFSYSNNTLQFPQQQPQAYFGQNTLLNNSPLYSENLQQESGDQSFGFLKPQEQEDQDFRHEVTIETESEDNQEEQFFEGENSLQDANFTLQGYLQYRENSSDY